MNTGLPPHGRVSLRSRLNFVAWRAMVEACWRDLPVGDVFGYACRGGRGVASGQGRNGLTRGWGVGLSAGAKQGYAAPFHSKAVMAGAVQWPR